MAQKKGLCIIRQIDVHGHNLCDLYEPKRKGRLKSRCKNCKHFDPTSTCANIDELPDISEPPKDVADNE